MLSARQLHYGQTFEDWQRKLAPAVFVVIGVGMIVFAVIDYLWGKG